VKCSSRKLRTAGTTAGTTASTIISAALQQVSHLHKGGLAAEGGMAVSGRRKRDATVPALQPPHGRREGTEYLDLATPRGRPWRGLRKPALQTRKRSPMAAVTCDRALLELAVQVGLLRAK
jgi:hypothetical protein